MKLTIIPVDKIVYKNNVPYLGLELSSVPANIHALQWNNNAGWIEFNDGTVNQDIESLPTWANDCITAWDNADFNAKNPPAPTPEELRDACKRKAKSLLDATDWAVLPDVGLVNQDAFVFYRLNLRNLVKNPIVDAVFEPAPKPIWS